MKKIFKCGSKFNKKNEPKKIDKKENIVEKEKYSFHKSYNVKKNNIVKTDSELFDEDSSIK